MPSRLGPPDRPPGALVDKNRQPEKTLKERFTAAAQDGLIQTYQAKRLRKRVLRGGIQARERQMLEGLVERFRLQLGPEGRKLLVPLAGLKKLPPLTATAVQKRIDQAIADGTVTSAELDQLLRELKRDTMSPGAIAVLQGLSRDFADRLAPADKGALDSFVAAAGSVQQKSPFTDTERAFFAKLNEYRKQNGLAPLRPSASLINASRDHARYLAATGQLTHNGPTPNTTFDQRIRRYFNQPTVGENVGSGELTADELFEAFRASHGHDANMRDPKFTHVGVGYAERDGVPYWVVDFGAVPASR